MNFTPKKITEARDRAAAAAMVDIDTFLAALDDIEKLRNDVKRWRDLVIITDTNGLRCVLCDGQDWDYEGVVHKDDCPARDIDNDREG